MDPEGGASSTVPSEDKTDLLESNEESKFEVLKAREEVSDKPEESPKGTRPNRRSRRRSSELDRLSMQLNEFSLPKILTEFSLDGIASYIKDKDCKNIITMVGAGISTAAGIPDFRSPGTGIYHNLKKYNLPYLQAIFELSYFKLNPEPFYHLARELVPGGYEPTKAHMFIKLLEDKQMLLRHYTQNIDNLDRLAGIPDDKLIESHGTFHTSHCLECSMEYDFQWLKEKIDAKEVPRCSKCSGLVKPDIIFFGESLPQKFFQSMLADFKRCDLLIIMGSSLEVEPFASLAMRTSKKCPRLIINANKVGSSINFLFGKSSNQRDVLWLGDCDIGTQTLADKLGWGEELSKLKPDSGKKSALRKIST